MKTLYKKSRHVETLLTYIQNNPRVSIAKACRKFKVKAARNKMKCQLGSNLSLSQVPLNPGFNCFNNALPKGATIQQQDRSIDTLSENTEQIKFHSFSSALVNSTVLEIQPKLNENPTHLLQNSLDFLENLHSQAKDLQDLRESLETSLSHLNEQRSLDSIARELNSIISRISQSSSTGMVHESTTCNSSEEL